MAKNRENVVDSASDSDSSSDNDSARSAGSESDSSDSEPIAKKTQSTKKKPSSSPTPAAAKKPIQKPASKPSSASRSESDSDSNPKDNPTPTPLNGSRKRKNKPAAADLVSEPEVRQTQATKKKKPSSSTPAAVAVQQSAADPTKPADTPKKPLIQRFWLEDDELVILRGMIKYRDQKKSDPAADCDALHNFIKGDLATKGSLPSQLENKIKRLKLKYKNNKKKEEKMKEVGKEMTFLKPIEERAYELSKRVWGSVVSDAAKETKKRTAAKEEKAVAAETAMAFGVKTMGATVEDMILSLGVDMFENGKGDPAVAREWKRLRLEEMEFNQRGLEAKTAMLRLVVDHLV